jgi:hypothetical protein
MVFTYICVAVQEYLFLALEQSLHNYSVINDVTIVYSRSLQICGRIVMLPKGEADHSCLPSFMCVYTQIFVVNICYTAAWHIAYMCVQFYR